MSDELTFDFNFDDGPGTTDAGGGGNKHFGRLRFYALPVVPFQKGESFTVPNVYDDKYDAESQTTKRQGLKQFAGMKLGKTEKNHRIFLLVLEKRDKAGNRYQVVKQFKSWKEKDRVDIWADRQFPAIRPHGTGIALTGEFARKNDSDPKSWAYVSVEDMASGDTFTDRENKTHDIKYWGNVELFTSEAAKDEAEKAFFAQFGQTVGSNGTAHNDYPVMWKSAPAELDKYVREHFATGEAKVKIVADTSMAGEAIDGSVVDIDSLLRRILDGSVPAPMLETWLVG